MLIIGIVGAFALGRRVSARRFNAAGLVLSCLYLLWALVAKLVVTQVRMVDGVGPNPGDIVVIGYDSGIIQINAIKDGSMAGAVQQNPVGIGAKCVEAAAMALQDMEVPVMLDTGYLWADAETSACVAPGRAPHRTCPARQALRRARSCRSHWSFPRSERVSSRGR